MPMAENLDKSPRLAVSLAAPLSRSDVSRGCSVGCVEACDCGVKSGEGGGDEMKFKRAILVLAAAMVFAGVPSAAFADHDCGPPDKHSDHSKGPDDRKNPCR